MNAIKDLNFQFLRQEESFGFHTLAIKEFARCGNNKLMELCNIYSTCLAKFDESLKQASGSAITAQLTELDNRRDAAYHGLDKQVHNAMRHFRPEKAEAAHKIYLILKRYGDPRSLPYIQESGTLENLLQDLNTADLQAALTVIDAADWKEEMQHANSEFVILFANRNEEQAAVITGLSKEARAETDNAYRNCVKRLNALIELNGIEDYQPLVDNMNRLIDYQKQVISARKTKNKSMGGEQKVQGE